VSTFKADVDAGTKERADLGIAPRSLDKKAVAALVEALKAPQAGEEEFLMEQLSYRVPPGVDDAAYVKASFLAAVVKGEASSPILSKVKAVELLGTMQGGYNVAPMIEALDDPELAPTAAAGLKQTLLMFDAFYDVEAKAKAGNATAKEVLESWAAAEWFLSKPDVPEKITVCVFKVTGETNTDDLSPAQDAWSRPDIPLHTTAMLKIARDGIHDCKGQIEELKKKGFPLSYVGDVVGTGSSRKSATNSVQWYMGDDIPFVPNKRTGSVCIGSKIAPIFFNTMEDSGAFPIEINVENLNMGDVIDIFPYEGVVKKHGTEEAIVNYELKTMV
jgi:aconitate hydratase 2/2-methylisocitrate dehydratase